MIRAAFALALVALVLLAARDAAAHNAGVSRADYVIDGTTVHASLLFRADELAMAFGPGDPSVATMLRLDSDGRACARAPSPATTAEPPDGARVRVDFTCEASVSALRIHADFLERFPSGHTHLISVSRAGSGVVTEAVALLAKPDVDVVVGRGKRPFFDLVGVGMSHILEGYDHLAFLLALVLVPAAARKSAGSGSVSERGHDAPAPSVRGLVAVLTAFTLGHTVSLAIATLSGRAPPSWLVEPAVALSIVYVAAENFFVKGWRHRWRITLPFGLVHGFAFAGGLLDLAVDRADLPRALLAFNLGVELGQLAVLALVLPLLFLARGRAWFPRVRLGLNGAVVLLGLVWFIQRVVHSL